MSDKQTYAGLEISEALRLLDSPLPPEAYKPIKKDGKDLGLTDVNPTFSQELINKAFGPMGAGWGFEELEFYRDGNYCAVKIKCWYSLHDALGAILQKVEWTARGGNSTEGNREWAEKGALTNALSAAWSLQGLQASVYKGLRTHETVEKELRDLRLAKDSDSPTPQGTDTTIEKPPVKTQKESQQNIAIPTGKAVLAALKVAGVAASLSRDGKTVYALPKYGVVAQKTVVTNAIKAAGVQGTGWDKGLPAAVHNLSQKQGAYVIPVSFQ